MNFFNRAIKNITRKPTKSIILAVTFFLIGNLVILGLGISSAADNAKVLTRQKMRAVVSLELDYDKIWADTDQMTADELDEFYQNFPRVDIATVKSLAADEAVKVVNYTMTNILYSNGFDNVPVGNEDMNNGGGVIIPREDTMEEQEYIQPNILLKTNYFPSMIEFEEGQYTIVEGRMYTQEDIDSNSSVVVIEQGLAEYNGIKVGDTMSFNLTSPSDLEYYGDAITEEDIVFEATVIGIYVNPEQIDPNSENFQWMSPYESPRNIVLMPSTAYAEAAITFQTKMNEYYQSQYPDETYYSQEITVESVIEGSSTAVYLLDDPLNVDRFVSEHVSTIGQYLKLNANDDTFKKLARPLDTLSLFANIIVWIVTINAVVIISLVTALTLKTREYEIGVLLSMGVSKVKIIAQMFLELMIVALLGFTLAVGTGILLSGYVGDAVLDYQVSNQEEDTLNNGYYYSYTSVWDNNYFTDITQDELLSEYHVQIGVPTILLLYVIGAGVVFIAILIPSAMVMRFNPKRILTNIQ